MNNKVITAGRIVTHGISLAAAVLLMAAETNAQSAPDSVTTDAGTIQADKVAPLFKKPGYSP